MALFGLLGLILDGWATLTVPRGSRERPGEELEGPEVLRRGGRRLGLLAFLLAFPLDSLELSQTTLR